MKRVLVGWLAVALGLAGSGQELQRGVTFSDGQTLSAAGLHQLIDSATVLPSFVTDKPFEISFAAGDQVLVYSPSLGGLYRCTGSTLLYGNTNFFLTQPYKGAPATNDLWMLWDADYNRFATISWTNLALAALESAWPTNLAAASSVDGGAQFLLWPGTAGPLGTNFYSIATATGLTRMGLVTNLPALTWWWANTNFYNFSNYWWQSASDAVMVLSYQPTNVTITDSGYAPKLVQEKVGDLVQWALPRYFWSNALTDSTGPCFTNIVHGLPGTPQSVRAAFLCLAADAGYSPGDEIDASCLSWHVGTGTNLSASWGANDRTLWLSYPSSGGPQMYFKGLGGSLQVTNLTWNASTWAARLYAIWYPPPTPPTGAPP